MTDDERKRVGRDKMRAWRARNPERAKTTNRRSYEANREKANARSRAWYAANRERLQEIKRRYFEDKEALERHRSNCRKSARRWRRENPEKHRAQKAKYDAQRRGAPAGDAFSHEEIAERDGWRCHICGRKVLRQNWSLDHLVPLSRGGSHHRENVALAHLRCNSARGNRGAAQLLLVG